MHRARLRVQKVQDVSYKGRHRKGKDGHPQGHVHKADIVLPDRFICRCGDVTPRHMKYRNTGTDDYIKNLCLISRDAPIWVWKAFGTWE